MQLTGFKIALRAIPCNRNIVRSVGVVAAPVKSSEDTAELRSWKEIPGPKTLPFIKQIHNFLPGGEFYKVKGITFGDMLYDKYGPIVRLELQINGPPMFFLFDPESCAQVLRSENRMPVRPGFPTLEHYRNKVWKTSVTTKGATGLLTDNGETWKEFRSIVNPIMMQPKTVRLYQNVLEEVARDMITRMQYLSENNKLNDRMEIEVNLWSLESIASVAFGRRLNCFTQELAADSPERRLIKCVHEIFKTMNILDFEASLWQWFQTPTFKKIMNLYAEQEELAKYFIAKAVEDYKLSSQKSDDEKGILEKLLEINEDVALIMATDMLFAGVDTVANTMLATLYHLGINLEKQEKLREELMSDEDKKPYLKACIKESMRIQPVVSGNLRQTTKELNILGYKMPKGMNIVFAHHFMSNMESYYPRAKEYIPERWLVEKSDPLYHGNAHPFANAPFGFGVRTCIGRRIAELEVEIFLTNLIKKYRIEWNGPPPVIKEFALNYVTGPFHFTFKNI